MRRTATVFVSFVTAIACTTSLAGAAVYSNGSKTSNFDASLKLVTDATISANPLDFGRSQGTLSTAINVNTTISVTATNTTPYNVGINAGTGTGSAQTHTVYGQIPAQATPAPDTYKSTLTVTVYF